MKRGLEGATPVRFNAAGWYRGELRREILRLKLNQDLSVLKAITFALRTNSSRQGSPGSDPELENAEAS